MVEGKNPSGGGMDISNTNTDMQIDWGMVFAKSVINILKPKIIMGLNGSEYHIGNTLDRRLLHRISLLYPNIEAYFGDSLKFFLGDKLWKLEHRGSEGMSMVGTLASYWGKINNKEYGRGRTPEVIGFAHIHQAQNPVQLKNSPNPVYGFVAPCQKMPDVHCSKGPIGAYWNIGFMYLEQNGKKLRGEYIETYPYYEKDVTKKYMKNKKKEVA
jgi:hypothetical protein